MTNITNRKYHSEKKPYSLDIDYLNFYKYPPTIELNKAISDVYSEVIKKSNSIDEEDSYTIYISVPFCRKKCNSCHFFKQLFPNNAKSEELLNTYVSYLIKQITEVGKLGLLTNKKCAAVFFGGGTASLLSVSQIQNILSTLLTYFSIDETTEITLEGNPNEFNLDYLYDVKKIGINRLSIGLQSFKEKFLVNVLNSPHLYTQSYSSIKNAMEIGFKTVNIDLLYNLPEQTAEDWMEELNSTLNFMPESITTNYYVVHKGSTSEKLIAGHVILPNLMSEQEIKDLEAYTSETLTKSGFIEYRTGSYAKPGHEQIYTELTYTRGSQFLGFGAGAYSFINGYLIDSPKYVKPYQEMIDLRYYIPIERISKKVDRLTSMCRFLIGNLMQGNIERNSFVKRFNSDVLLEFSELMNYFKSNDYIKISDEKIELTEIGWRWRKNIMKEFYII